MVHAARRSARAFSLVELVIVVVIIGIIGAIAIPRLSRGSASASDNALRGNLSVLRRAIELYAAEHDGKFPTDHSTIADQLLKYSDITGATSAAKSPTHIYGPYIANAIPTLPVGTNKGKNDFIGALGGTAGWVYVNGTVTANLPDSEADASGTKYNSY